MDVISYKIKEGIGLNEVEQTFLDVISGGREGPNGNVQETISQIVIEL